MTLVLDMPETLLADGLDHGPSGETARGATTEIDLEQMGIEAANGHAVDTPASIPADVPASESPPPALPSENDSGLEIESVTTVGGNEEVSAAVSTGEAGNEGDEPDPNEREAEERLCNCQLRIAALKRELKFAKAELEEATETLEGIRRRGERKDSDEVHAEIAAESLKLATESPPLGDPTTPPTDAPDEPIDWRSVPLAALGLKEATAKRLAEHDVATLGQLEDLRAKGNVKGVGLRSIKGIGDAKVTEIEDAVIAWLSKHPQTAQAVADQPAGEGEDTELHEPPATTLADEPAAAATTTTADATESPADYDPETPESRKRIAARAAAINDGSPSCLDKKIKGKGYWEAGQQHCREGHPLTECGVIPGPEQDDYIRGYLAEQLLEEFEPTEK